MQEDHERKRGVLQENADFYDRFSMDAHGLGQRHDPATCTVPACGHSHHGASTAGDNFPKPLSAGTVYNGEDARPLADRVPPEERDRELGEAHNSDECKIPKCVRCNRVDEATMQPGYTIVKGGGSSSRKKKSNRGGAAIPPYIMTSYPHPDKVKESEEERAKRLARENEQRIEQSTNRPGRKVQGKEKRMHVQGTMEPTKVADLNEMTGKTCIELLENVHEILAMAKSGAERAIIVEAVMSLLKDNGGDVDGGLASVA